jgi:hypothetical protein
MGIATIAVKLKSIFGFLATDSTGSVQANVVHRTGLLADLDDLVAPEGEIAFATDKKALVLVSSSGAGVIHSSGPGGIPAADIETGVVGYFAAGTHSYTYPAAGNATYANLQALITYLEQCDFSRNASLTVSLAGVYSELPGTHVQISADKDLSMVTLSGGNVSGSITNISSVVGAAAPYAITFASTLAPVVGTAVIFYAYVTSNELALAGAHIVTASSGSEFTIEFNGDTPPTAGVQTITCKKLGTKIPALSCLQQGSNVSFPRLSNIATGKIYSVTKAILSGDGDAAVIGLYGDYSVDFMAMGSTATFNNLHTSAGIELLGSSLFAQNVTAAGGGGGFTYLSAGGRLIVNSVLILTGNKGMGVAAAGATDDSAIIGGLVRLAHADIGVALARGSKCSLGDAYKLANVTTLATLDDMTTAIALDTQSAATGMSFITGTAAV